MQVLVVESQHAPAKSLELLLNAERYAVSVTASGEEAIELAAVRDYDAILLSLDLADMDGVQVLRTLRARKIGAPVIMLGAAEVATRVEALASGADDVMAKPFHKVELTARLAAVVRRARSHADPILAAGLVALNLATRQAEVAGQRVHLTPSEYKMLELFLQRKNSVLSKEQCLSHLYHGLSEPEPKIIDVFICKLRKKLAAPAGGVTVIETVWGGGYMVRDAAEPRLAA